MLVGDDGYLCLTDFGLARIIKHDQEKDEDEVARTYCGTTNYMAPEIIQSNDGYRGPPADLFAVGVLLFSMVASQFPFRQARADSDTLF